MVFGLGTRLHVRMRTRLENGELEEHFGTNYTDAILEGGDEVSMQEVKRVVKQVDRVSKFEKCRERAPLIVFFFFYIKFMSGSERSAMARLGVRDFEIHWISRGFRISEWISGFQSGFLDFI